jgi:hypothetical protein
MICYHGTIKKYFLKIKKFGLREYSYLTPFLMSALGMGGPYIIGIEIPEVNDVWLGKGNWEYRNPNLIFPDHFLFSAKFSNKLLFYNRGLNEILHEKRIKDEGHIICKKCSGYGELTYLNDGHNWKIGGSRFDYHKSRSNKKCIICPDCKGFGYTDS